MLPFALIRRAFRSVPLLRPLSRVVVDVTVRLTDDDGWAIASHMAMAALMALFPFLIFVAALAGTLSTPNLVGEIVKLLFEAWPPVVAAPIASEVDKVLGSSRPDLLTVGGVLAIFLATNGVEAVRIGLNRAYRVRETRPFWICRLQSLLFVLVAAAALIVLSFLLVLWPVLWQMAVSYFPLLDDLALTASAVRFGLTFVVAGGAILLAHCKLTAGGQTIRNAWPGALVTFTIWLAIGLGFGIYLADFTNYSRTYAGLAGVAVALFFLWLISVVFLIGAEVNAVLLKKPFWPRRGNMDR